MNSSQQRISSKLDSAKRAEFERFVTLYDRAEYAHLHRKILRKWLSSRLGLSMSERHFRRVMNGTAT